MLPRGFPEGLTVPQGRRFPGWADGASPGGTRVRPGAGAQEVRTSSGVLLPHAPASVVTARWQISTHLHEAGVVVQAPGLGPVTYDMAFGGNFYAILSIDALGLPFDRARKQDILDAGLALRLASTPQFYGFQLAKTIVDRAKASTALTAHGTLYKALARMEDAGLLTSAWEAPDTAAADGRPRRRLYEITGAGERALAAHQAQHPATPRPRPAAGLDPA